MADDDTPRTHTLTDDELIKLMEIAARSRSWPEKPIEVDRRIAALPSRAPVDPDAGLRAPWSSETGFMSGVRILDADAHFMAVIHRNEAGDKYDTRAVNSAILATPSAIALARRVAITDMVGPNLSEWQELQRVSREVLKIADAYKKAKA